MPQYSTQDFQGTFWTITDGDYYVSTIGNDITGNGSPKNPFLTIAKAFEIAEIGHKIVIGPNEYVVYGGVSVDQSGADYPCRVATTTNIALGTGGLMTIDGVLLSEGDRVLVWKQTGPAQNGVYISSSGAWVRDSNFSNSENIVPGKLFPVLSGNTYGGSIFQLVTPGPVNVGSTALEFHKSNVGKWGELVGEMTAQEDLVNALAEKSTPKGLLDCSSNPLYPSGKFGDYYYVSVAGKIGGVSGLDVQVGTRVECIVAQSAGGDYASVESEWIVQSSSSGGVAKQGTPASGQISVWADADTVLGNPGLVFEDNQLIANGDVIANDAASEQSIYLTHENGFAQLDLGNNWSFKTHDPELGPPDFGIVNHNNGDNVLFINSDSQVTIYDSNGKGAQYGGDYSSGNAANPRWIPDKAYVDSVAAEGGDVSKVGTPVNNQVAIWAGDGIIKGDTGLSLSSGVLSIGENNRITGVAILSEHPDGHCSWSLNTSGNQTINNTIALKTTNSIYTQYVSIGSNVDSGSAQLIQWYFQKDNLTQIGVRPLWEAKNFNQNLWRVSANGNWDYQENYLNNIGQLNVDNLRLDFNTLRNMSSELILETSGENDITLNSSSDVNIYLGAGNQFRIDNGLSFGIQTFGSLAGQTIEAIAQNLILNASNLFVLTDIKRYQQSNNGNPSYFLGSSNLEQLQIQAVYDSGAQTLDYVRFNTFVENSVADKGRFVFAVDEVNILEILDSGLSVNENIGLGTSTLGANASKVLAIANGTAPTSSPADMVQLFAEDVSNSSELKVRDEAGNITTLSPHNFSLIPDGPSEEMAWSYYSEKDGRAINIDMAKLARLVEKLTGEKLIFIEKLKSKTRPKTKSKK